MSTLNAKALNGHDLNGFQPINGELGALQTLEVAFWTSSQVYDWTQGESARVTFWESSQVYPPTVFSDESAIGETICVPNPITQQNCEVIC